MLSHNILQDVQNGNTKRASPISNKHSNKGYRQPGKILRIISWLFLIGCILGGFIFFLIASPLNITAFIIILSFLWVGIIGWAFLITLSSITNDINAISDNLKEINSFIKQDINKNYVETHRE